MNVESGCSVAEQLAAQNDEMKRRVLVMKALELSQTIGPINDEAYTDALRAMESLVPVKQKSIDAITTAAIGETSRVRLDVGIELGQQNWISNSIT